MPEDGRHSILIWHDLPYLSQLYINLALTGSVQQLERRRLQLECLDSVVIVFATPRSSSLA